nr:hypothetical protein [Fodinicola acaciae]
MDAVAADQQVAGRGRTVGEARFHTVVGRRRVDELLAVVHRGAALARQCAERRVQIGAPEHLRQLAVRTRRRHRHPAQLPAFSVDEPHRVHVIAEVLDRTGGVDGAQRVHPVGLEGEPGAALLRAGRVALVHGAVDADPLQRHRQRGAGDAASDDQCVCHLQLL